jgi:adenylate cyclase
MVARRHRNIGLLMIRDWINRMFEQSGEADVPERVRTAIRDQQDASEILIGWVQLAVVLIFAILYTVAPKTFSADVGFAPVPWALSAYFAFTVVRIIMAYRLRLPNWLLSVSVIMDMTLLLGTIWSFHLQYEQPPSFYLKAPTLLYVFIFIALRALRFEAHYVVLAGCVAAMGWLVMAFYAVAADPSGAMITRDYVQYMTTNSILLGAEFDKVISILLVTAIIAVAITRARRLLVRAVAEGAAAQDLSRFFAPEIAKRITGAEARVKAGQGIARDAAILNVDVRGFTILAAHMPANDLIALLAQYQARMVPVIQRHDGTIDKFLGDGIMATFGATSASETYTADAIRAVDEVMAVADAWNAERVGEGKEPIRIGAAVANGRIVFGAVGDETRLEYTVIGDAVNVSAKLEKHTKVEKVRALATARAYEKALAQGYAPKATPERRAARHIIGTEEPIDVVVLAS